MGNFKHTGKRRWPLVLILVLVGLCIIGAGLVFGIDAYVRSVVADRIVTEKQAVSLENVDCVLVLGCGLDEDGSPSPMLHDRLEQGIALYKAGAAPKLLVSGDHGSREYDEVNTMKDYAKAAGVPSTDIFMDHAGFSTYESLYRARDVFQAKKVLVVTQKYHLYRALYIAKALGLDASGVSSDPRTYGGQLARDIREILARDKDFFSCLFKPEPTYLGEAVPVNGNGDVTNDKDVSEK